MNKIYQFVLISAGFCGYACKPTAANSVQADGESNDQVKDFAKIEAIIGKLEKDKPVPGCVEDGFGLPAAPLSPKFSGPIANEEKCSLSKLPPLKEDASTPEIKKFVSDVYDLCGLFKEIYEGQLKLSKGQALAYMFSDMSRESFGSAKAGTDDCGGNWKDIGGKDRWRITLETSLDGRCSSSTPNPGHAWGPFQAAVTNFKGGGFDSEIKNKTGLPTPDIKDFKTPNISTFAGMKRLLEGIVASFDSIGPNRSAIWYLQGALAHHNNGWVNSMQSGDWITTYGNDVTKKIPIYVKGDNLTNDVAFYTGQSTEMMCQMKGEGGASDVTTNTGSPTPPCRGN